MSILSEKSAQGSVELILILGGLICIVLILAFVYKSYVSDLTNEINSNELNDLNESFKNISKKFA